MAKAMKLGQMSRNKLSKKQLKELRERKYHIFERSYENCIFQLNYCKAVVRSFHKDSDIFKHTIKRIERMYDFIHEKYPKELKELGYVDNDIHYINLGIDRKLRAIKLTFIV